MGAAGAIMWVQAIIWRDRKLVGLLSNYEVCAPGEDVSCLRHVAGQRERQAIPTHNSLKLYSRFMNGVDRMDRGVADWGLNMLLLGRWYLRLMLWCVSVSIHCMFTVIRFAYDLDKSTGGIQFLSGHDDYRTPWRRYIEHEHGRYRFQQSLCPKTPN